MNPHSMFNYSERTVDAERFRYRNSMYQFFDGQELVAQFRGSEVLGVKKLRPNGVTLP